jgi:hypothetical protein
MKNIAVNIHILDCVNNKRKHFRFGVREVEPAVTRRVGVREVEPAVTRRIGVREELDGTHDELQHRHHPRYYDVSRPDFRTQKIAKKTSRAIQRKKDKFLRELELGTQEVEHTLSFTRSI